MQDPIRGWERQQEILFNNGSSEDSGAATLSSTDTSGTVRSLVSLNTFDLTINRHSFDYTVFEGDTGEEDDVGNKDDDDSDEDFVDDQNKENLQPLKLTAEQDKQNQHPALQLKRSNGVPFERLENCWQPVNRSLFEKPIEQLKFFVNFPYHLILLLQTFSPAFIKKTFQKK